MNESEFATIVKTLKAVYTDPKFIEGREAMEIWFRMLKDIPYEVMNIAVQKYLSTQKFPPTIADLRETVQSITDTDEMTELQAWGMVYKAICNSVYHAEEEFEKLPGTCQKAIGNAANLREMAKMDIDTVNSVEQSHFIRNYRTIAQREKEEKRLSLELKAKSSQVILDMSVIKQLTEN